MEPAHNILEPLCFHQAFSQLFFKGMFRRLNLLVCGEIELLLEEEEEEVEIVDASDKQNKKMNFEKERNVWKSKACRRGL